MFATLNGHQVLTASVVLPFKGVWTADVTTSEAVTLTGSVTLVIADLTLVGTIFRGGSFLGTSSFRIVGGAGGWKEQIPAKFYRNAFGLKSAPIITDAAREVRETVQVTSDRGLGQAFTREAGPASRVLGQLTDLWWVRPDGVTEVGPRSAPIISTPFEVMSFQPELGKVVVATDNPAQWQPGVKFTSTTLSQRTASSITHKLSKANLRTEIWNG